MSNHRYATKAHNEARINGRRIKGKPVDSSRAINRLTIAMRNDLNENSSPADWVRSNAAFAKAVANGTVETLASRGPSQAFKDELAHLDKTQAIKDALARLDKALGFSFQSRGSTNPFK